MQLMGLTWDSFSFLLDSFRPILLEHWATGLSAKLHPHCVGRRSVMGVIDVLGLTLAWLHVPTDHVMLMLGQSQL